ncbi:hypothetical protein BJX70DRAFT_393341 [Aspergillus crustosus]
MSDLSGRQSPPPDQQSGAQGNSPPASGNTDPKFAPPPEYAPNSSKGEDIEAAKYKKGTGN